MQEQGLQPDPAQKRIVEAFCDLTRQLTAKKLPHQRFWCSVPVAPIKGCYLWGEVGRGKTWLMDLFYQQLPIVDKIRLHYYDFMEEIHHGLRRHRGHPQPLTKVAEQFVDRARVWCLDEFIVDDVADAMLMKGLLQALFARSITLVVTSNQAPDVLYRDGLQYPQFAPAIALLKQNMHILELIGETDFRQLHRDHQHSFYTPAGPAADRLLAEQFEKLATEKPQENGYILILGRRLKYRLRSVGVIWFDFSSICASPRSNPDYIQLAKEYHTVLISDVPAMSEQQDDLARRFIEMVDEFYDRRLRLLLSTAVAYQQLYSGQRLQFAFTRTRSRLLDMQSTDYLGQAPKSQTAAAGLSRRGKPSDGVCSTDQINTGFVAKQ